MFTKKTLRIFVNIIQETGNHVSCTGSGVGVRGPRRGGGGKNGGGGLYSAL